MYIVMLVVVVRHVTIGHFVVNDMSGRPTSLFAPTSYIGLPMQLASVLGPLCSAS